MLSYLSFWQETEISEKTNNLNQHKIGCTATLFFPDYLKALTPKTLPYLMLDSLIHAQFSDSLIHTHTLHFLAVHKHWGKYFVVQILQFTSHKSERDLNTQTKQA